MTPGASNPLGGFLSAIPFLELSVLPGKEVTVLVGDRVGGELWAFLGGRPSLDGPGPSELRNDGVGAGCQYCFKGSRDDLHEAGNDFVFFSMFLLGDAFFFPLPFMIDSATFSDKFCNIDESTHSFPSCWTDSRYRNPHSHYRSY